VLAGTFREDLYYRIACLNIRLPGLRERISDIPLLAQNLLEGINRSMRCSYQLMPDALEQLKRHDYPGNVRELRNILFIAATHSINREIDASLIEKVMKNLPQCASQKDSADPAPGNSSTVSSEAPVAEVVAEQPVSLKGVEEQHIRTLLDQFNGNRKLVAETLGISERTIYRKLKALGIN
jgi:DNA-binding NtrC family response regulator